MVGQFLSLFEDVFSKCATWTWDLLDAVQGNGVVTAAFFLVLVISLLFIPLRGNSISAISDYTTNPMHKKKYNSNYARKNED